jgi:hypothetical protein
MTSTNVFEARYDRSIGVHDYMTQDGTAVTAVAQPNWETFVNAFRDLSPTEGYIISPELITAPADLADIKGQQTEIEDRVETMREMSVAQPDATILLGTPSRDNKGLLRNSLVVIRNGNLDGHIDKQGPMWPDEAELFSRRVRPQATLIGAGHAAVICSDMITASVLGPALYSPAHSNTETMLVSSMWAIPRLKGPDTPAAHEVRFKTALEKTVGMLMLIRPNLREVIMVDRAVQGSTVQPFSAHFKRT